MKAIFLITYLSCILKCVESATLEKCTDPRLNFKGYTYTVDLNTSEPIWSHCRFPDPRFDLSRCGRPDSSSKSYICDPDRLLPTSEADVINEHLLAVQTNTSTVCGEGTLEESYIAAAFLINRIRVPDMASDNRCLNDCDEIYPELDRTSRIPTDSELTDIMENFGDSLRTHLNIGSCDNGVVIFYCKEYNRVYTSVGSKAATLLTEAEINKLEASFLLKINEGKAADAFLLLAEGYRTSLRGITPAFIMLIANISILVLTALFLLFFLCLKPLEFAVWGKTRRREIVDRVLYYVCGMWFAEFTFVAVFYLQHKMPYWGAVVILAIAIAFVVIYVLDDQVFSKTTANTNSSAVG